MIPLPAATRLRYQLMALPGLAATAYEDLAPSSHRGTGMPTGTRTPPLPVREDILSLLGPGDYLTQPDPNGDQTGDIPIPAMLSNWCQIIWGYPCTGISTAVEILLRHHTRACAADYAADYARDISTAHQRLEALARTYAPPLSVRCPRCTQLTLAVDPGRGYLCCDPDCHTRLNPDQYDHLAEEQINKETAHREAAAGGSPPR
ncbi:hypothetical protein ACEZCY_14550 [Streptacidiphilus sp. N1-12]|uniref:Uncharacterized protein n=2 Tax=Streptacidiphilus alkalitolerans TaxID=3342712 RepID=A0ABV6V9T1_9ACTN